MKYVRYLICALAGLHVSAGMAAEPCQPGETCLVKTVDNLTPQVGDQVTFTLTATNDKPDDLSGIYVNDQLADGFTYVSSLASTGSYDSVTGRWDVGTLAAGAAETLAITVTVNGTVLPLGQRAAHEVPDGQNVPASFSPGELLDYSNIAVLVNPADSADQDSDSVVLMPVSADLQANVTQQNQAIIGETHTLSFQAVNHGPAAATSVQSSIILGPGFTYESSVPTHGSFDAATGIWTIGSMSEASVARLTVHVHVEDMGPHLASMSLSADEHDPQPDNNHAQAMAYPGPSDLSITKSVDRPAPLVHELVNFTVTVSNAGPGLAPVVDVRDPLQAGFTYVSSTATAGSYNPVTGTWGVGSMVPYTSQTLVITAQINLRGPYENIAWVNDSTIFRDGFEAHAEPPVDPGQMDSAIVYPTSTDLSVTKTADNLAPNVGDQVTFTVTASNAGPGTATGVVVTDQLEAGFTYASSSTTQGSFDPGTGVWSVGTLPAGTSEVLTLVATVNPTGPYTNSVSIGGDQHEPNPGDEDDVIIITPGSADLSVAKTVDNPTANVGDQVVFTVTASNAGPATATGVVVTDQLEAGFTFVSSNATQGSYNAGTGLWTVGTLSNGGSATLMIVATVNPTGPYTNSVSIVGDQHDPNPGGDDDEIIIEPESADLTVVKSANTSTPRIGDQVEFLIVAGNNGPADATGVVVTDQLEAGFSYVSSSANQGSYDPATGLWSVGGLPSGSNVELRIQARVNPTGPYHNVASIEGHQPDPNPIDPGGEVELNPSSPVQPVMVPVDNPTALLLLVGLLTLFGCISTVRQRLG